MKKKEVNINEESTSAGGAHAVNKFRISDFVMMAVIVILCASCVLPFLHVAVKSISGNTAVMSKSVYFWPKDITFDAYKKVFADNSMTYSMIFSVIVTVIFTALGMLVCTCAAYPLSKKRLKGKKLLTFLLMVDVYKRQDRRKILGRERAGGRGKHGNADLFSAGTGQRHV